jgi:hypothetical protein
MNIILQFIQFIKVKLGNTPMCQVIKTINNKWGGVSKFNTLELFGFDGSFHSRDYFNQVNTLDVWEIDENCKTRLEKNLPGANILIVDTFKQIKVCDKVYDMVICDNPMSTYGDGYCEHFSIFPDVFNIMKTDSILILNICPRINEKVKIKYPYIFNDLHLNARTSFYKSNHPEYINIDKMKLCP